MAAATFQKLQAAPRPTNLGGSALQPVEEWTGCSYNPGQSSSECSQYPKPPILAAGLEASPSWHHKAVGRPGASQGTGRFCAV